MKKVTMQDIADSLGISKGLVSISLNNKYGVSDETRFKVYLKAVELGYDFKYNYGTKDSKSKNITVFIKKEELLENGYWVDLLVGVENILNSNNYNLKLEVWGNETKENEILVKARETQSIGIIILNELPIEDTNKILSLKLPVVFIDSKGYTDLNFDTVRVNNYLGGYLVGEYFLKNNHKNVCFVGDKEFSISFRERYYGFKNFIDEHQDLVFKGIIKQSTYDKSEEFINESNVIKALKEKNRPTALFCANDNIAKFVYSEIKKMNLRIPEDVSVVGFDNQMFTNMMEPSLTSVNVLKNELGVTAVELLLDKIKFPNTPKKTIFLSVDLDIKKSVKEL